MEFYEETRTKDGRALVIRATEKEYAAEYLDYFVKAHSETDFLTTYPDESSRDVESTEKNLKELKASDNAAEICALVDGKLVGSAGFSMVHDRAKTRHRADFGISIVKDYWGLGIGEKLTRACIELAKKAGYLQLELEVVAENVSAINLYKKLEFVEFGRNPKAFHTRAGRWQELILMRLEL